MSSDGNGHDESHRTTESWKPKHMPTPRNRGRGYRANDQLVFDYHRSCLDQAFRMQNNILQDTSYWVVLHDQYVVKLWQLQDVLLTLRASSSALSTAKPNPEVLQIPADMVWQPPKSQFRATFICHFVPPDWAKTEQQYLYINLALVRHQSDPPHNRFWRQRISACNTYTTVSLKFKADY